METRALAIAFFYAIGTGLGGIIGPLLFGHLIATNDRNMVMIAFLIGAGVMALGGVAELFLGVRAENTQLEDVAKPLTAEEAETGELAGEKSGENGDRRHDGRRSDEALARSGTSGARSAQRSGGRRRTDSGRAAARTSTRPECSGRRSARGSYRPAVLDREVDSIVGAVERDGPLRRDQIARQVRAALWGPGRFAAAFREALAENLIRRSAGSQYEAVESRERIGA